MSTELCLLAPGRPADHQGQAAHERAKWQAYFSESLADRGQECTEGPFWTLADRDAVNLGARLLAGRPGRVLEAGCGAGDMTSRLAQQRPLAWATYLDLAPNALALAKRRAPACLAGRSAFVVGNITEMPIKEESFDLVWNVGVLEHYRWDFISRAVASMLRAVRPGGYLAVAIPNRRSIATLKAFLLGTAFGRRFLSFIPGYRFDSERLYGNRQMATSLARFAGQKVQTGFAGSCLWVDAPPFLVRALDRWLASHSFCFLTFFMVRKEARR